MSPAGPGRYGFVILAMGLLSNMGALGFGRFTATLVLPGMRASLGLSYTEMGLVASANFVAYVCSAAVSGYFVSRYGSRVVATLSLFGTGVGLVASALAGGLAAALSAQALVGLASVGAVVSNASLVAAWFAPRRRATAYGVCAGGAGWGLLVAGLAVPALLQGLGPDRGWRVSWGLVGVVTLLMGGVTWALLRDRPGGARGAPAGVPSRLHLYSSRAFWHLGLVYAAFGFSYVIYSTFFGAYLHDERRLGVALVGLMWAVLGMLSAFSSILWGWLADRAGRLLALALSLLVLGGATLSLALPWPPAAWLSALAFGLSAFAPPGLIGTLCGDWAGPRHASAAFGFVTVLFGVGQALGPPVAGRVADLTGSFVLALVVAAAAAGLGALLAATCGRGKG